MSHNGIERNRFMHPMT